MGIIVFLLLAIASLLSGYYILLNKKFMFIDTLFISSLLLFLVSCTFQVIKSGFFSLFKKNWRKFVQILHPNKVEEEPFYYEDEESSLKKNQWNRAMFITSSFSLVAILLISMIN